jgi:2-polyprenyl-3-methyl-5-hydroxy-6-metoxy-1,4-benzoquinol methylase
MSVGKRVIKAGLRHLGYGTRRSEALAKRGPPASIPEPPPVDPIWPLPRHPGGRSDEEIRSEFAKYEFWHYPHEFEGGLSFPPRHNIPSPLVDIPERHLQRFKHFMPYLVQAQNGSLAGKRILDIACNCGFYSIQCALLGAEVVGFDARVELVEQANLVKSIVGVDKVEFRVLDFWDMSPETLGGTFDAVLSLGILYHLPNPLDALQLTKFMAREAILLDTAVSRSDKPVFDLKWEEPTDIRMATSSGIVAHPSRSAIDMMLKHIGAADGLRFPFALPI